MRIGFDAKRAFFNHSGLGNYSRTLISQLCQLFPDNEYFLFTPKESKDISGFPPSNTELVSPGNIIYRQMGSVWRSGFMGRTIASKHIDIFHGLSNELPLDIKKSNAVSILTIHDLIFMRYPELYRSTDRAIYKSKFHRSCRQADRVVAISEQTKEDIIHFFNIKPEKIRVIYQGCSPLYYEKAGQDFKQRVKQKYSLPEKYILYVGTIEERKNLLQLVKAIHEYKIDVPLIVVGRPTPYHEKVIEYISQKKVSNIQFLRDVLQEDLPSIYQMAEVFVYPSSFEGFGIPILEALNSGTPVITGTGGCLQETGGPDTIYVNPQKTEEIAASINQLLDNSELRRKMIEAGYIHARGFREERTANEIMKLYKELI
ncbi:MAG: glycosyltransferase family 4 protein [Bacteroidales bacterium]|nr:glycosyltransferase family 4 protein [Bacteroidales bacterium]MCB8998586.1 glycosyltransferase family 4 protein [Bacteroidales bacterium]MCB9012546.1 glycosyltransferase family 4 protein [Bacteroidales bacterium]